MLEEKLSAYRNKEPIPRITPTKYKKISPLSEKLIAMLLLICHCCGYKKEDLILHEKNWVCSVCGESHDRDVNASVNLYIIGLERPRAKPVEHALVDKPYPYGIPKKTIIP
jgi:hypothetical protein